MGLGPRAARAALLALAACSSGASPLEATGSAAAAGSATATAGSATASTTIVTLAGDDVASCVTASVDVADAGHAVLAPAPLSLLVADEVRVSQDPSAHSSLRDGGPKLIELLIDLLADARWSPCRAGSGDPCAIPDVKRVVDQLRAAGATDQLAARVASWPPPPRAGHAQDVRRADRCPDAPALGRCQLAGAHGGPAIWRATITHYQAAGSDRDAAASRCAAIHGAWSASP
jgi:hypothetical protein|nr:hypothetical protein [Kofleriaceae bacterium]